MSILDPHAGLLHTKQLFVHEQLFIHRTSLADFSMYRSHWEAALPWKWEAEGLY